MIIMKKPVILIFIMVFVLSQQSFAWDKKGHDAIAYIAECNLTAKAKKNIEKYLGHSIVYYASWMDEYRSTPEYKQTSEWHMAHVDDQLYYTDSVRSPKGDAVCELENAIAKLKNYKQLNDSTVVVNLKYVIHLVGDMHCPVHVFFPHTKMRFNIKLKNKEYNYHDVWDYVILDMCHDWSYTEYQQQLDRCTNAEKSRIAAGTPRDWFHETAVDCKKIYEMALPNSEQGKDFLNAAHPLAESQILKAGYRLARILNELFG
jgi:hypothetical protein